MAELSTKIPIATTTTTTTTIIITRDIGTTTIRTTARDDNS